ncbi:CAP-Gly domain-containing linker protein 4-like [Myxocyprinus asiaticus]|uniref:CAP-Gly domain-containing linker protein 4-like n=1 Tax=Myxocyprinus asiaticus TaxID=70543 RepID=UPI00222259AB|nr:CAP-Gly domain-containing linker protein 4-like [Myxocyprinus asiaticus]
MATYILWSAAVWTLKSLLCTWRFFWVSPYYTIKSAPWTQHAADSDQKTQLNLSTAAHDVKHHGGTNVNEKKTRPEKCVHRERTGVLQKRLLTAEGEIQDLKTEIANQRASWEMRFMELQRRQNDLREQLNSEILVRSGMLYRDTDSEESNEVFTESGLENGLDSEEKEHKCSSDLSQIHQQKGSDIGLLRDDIDQKSICCSQISCPSALGSRTTSAMSNTSIRSWRSGGPHRVFVPHSPLDLKIGHRVRIMLPSGRISTGTLRYLGYMQNSPDFYLGVELELADNGQYDGTYEGQSYFDCEPGHGVFVAFSKLLMAWE